MSTRAAEERAGVLSPEERRRRNREEMRGAILDAARAVMREQGVAALSLREVARRVKMQAPSLYTYFPSKMALYDAVFLEGTCLARTYLDPAAQQGGPFATRLHAWLEAYMRFAQEHPELFQLCFERPVPGFVPSEESMRESLAAIAPWNSAIADAIAGGEITGDLSTEQARDILFAMGHGLTSQHMANEPHLPVGSGRYGGLIPVAARVLLAGLSPESHAERGGDSP